jgi:hypothetical protein
MIFLEGKDWLRSINMGENSSPKIKASVPRNSLSHGKRGPCSGHYGLEKRLANFL